MPDAQTGLILGLGVWALAIAVSDIRRLRVPNVLLLLVAVPALLIQLFLKQGVLGITTLQAVEGFALGFGLLFPGYLSGKVGAGDVKFAGVIGFLVGLVSMFEVFLIAGLLLGFVSLLAYIEMRFYRAVPRKIPAGACLSAGLVLNLLGVSLVEVIGHA